MRAEEEPAADTGAERRRLLWRCRRGMRELDALLMRYMERRYPLAGASEQAAFRDFLSLPDPEILALLTGRAGSDDAATTQIVGQILAVRIS